MTKTDKIIFDAFEKKLIITIGKYKMLEKGDRVLVGLSGGKDSVALLFALNRLSSFLEIEVSAFHLNHGIRGEEAKRDEHFSRDFAEKLGIPFEYGFFDVPSEKEKCGETLEAVARRVRYNALNQCAKKLSCNKIATAHSASDNSETVLFTLCRNSVPRGIPPLRDNIVRPLICHSTAEIMEYCRSHSLKYVYDSTNSSIDYSRNYIRQEVLPKLLALNPAFDKAMGCFSDIQRRSDGLSRLCLDKYLENNSSPFSLKGLLKLAENEALHGVLFLLFEEKLTEYGVSLSSPQFEDIVKMIKEGRVHSKIDVGEGISVMREYESLEFVKNIERDDPPYEITLTHGANPIPDSNIVLWVETPEEYRARQKNVDENIKVNKLTKNSLIKYNIINARLFARPRKDADAFLCRGITRRIKKFMIDEKIPPALREKLPIVCTENEIVWTAGLGANDKFVRGDGGEDVISLSISFE